jgi:hypothetical protein
VRAVVEPLWLSMEISQSILSGTRRRAIISEAEAMLRREALLPPRRARSCARAPVSKWPRLLTRTGSRSLPALHITRIKKS